MSENLQIFEQLVKVETRLWNRLDRALSEQCDVTLGQLVALRMLDAAPGSRVQDLAADIDISPGGASKLADRLVAAGLVERAADDQDRRASRLHLTKKGRAVVRDGSRSGEAWLAERFGDAGDTKRLGAVLDDLRHRLDAEAGAA
jgi:DNA-binding MarR family transcriptional regulator